MFHWMPVEPFRPNGIFIFGIAGLPERAHPRVDFLLQQIESVESEENRDIPAERRGGRSEDVRRISQSSVPLVAMMVIEGAGGF